MSEKSIRIKSHKGQYQVDFSDQGSHHLVSNLPEQTYHLIVDKRVADLYQDKLKNILNYDSLLMIEASEYNKSLELMPKYVSHLVDNKIRRDDVLIAVGGGIIQDITCFLAATLLRGIDWCFYPTTLLSQADSCIGSKSSINCGDSKNLVGTFTPPKKVVIGYDFLNTLDDVDVRSGVGEMLKVHAIAGPEYFDNISDEYHGLFSDSKTMMHFIRRSLEIKKEYIEIDEFDQGPRNIFNYGHSFGHAIEAATNFLIPHGIAVTIGMDMANWLSPQIGSGDMTHYERMHKVLAANYHDFADVVVDLDLFMSALSKDKKNIGKGEVTLILPDSNAKIEKGRYPNDLNFADLCDRYLTEVRTE
ncbi:3-dehydroquinate synthase [hydrothermal vent metagenome]|uniref:3-dehydroquinate synthase n=1 Tax=hydrothermal vent metagenome TaxID=652676 RepID=A0A3B0Y3G9_9ZZZZ